ncbi:MAG TPA: hypothetical protein VFW65_19225 [Pseudonocardiaceae bacterium]|nr:hypothetical protein [Pseudonocardiaceae bacterium]
MTDWAAWHDDYERPDSGLSRRLLAVQRRVREALDGMPPGPVRAISMCAGQGRDLLGVLADHPRRADVTARLVELDPRNVAAARAAAPANVEVVEGDATAAAVYAGLVPADLVLVCGVFGNVTDDGVHTLVGHLPMLCRTGGTVVWTRHVDPPDLTPEIRNWLRDSGFHEVGFDTEPGRHHGVGAHVLAGPTLPYQPDVTLFRFR